MTHKIHPAADIFPMMDANSLRELADDIKENGLWESIDLYQGQVIDGRNRLKACEIAGVEPEFAELIEYDGFDAVKHVLSKNLHRRHLTTSQRAMIAARLKDTYSEQAKDRQGNRSDLKNDIPVNLPESRDARDEAGKALSVSGSTVDHASAVLRNGSAELVQLVESGKVSVSKAAAVAKSTPKEKQVEVATTDPAPIIRVDHSNTLPSRMIKLSAAIGQEFDRWNDSENAIFVERLHYIAREVEEHGRIRSAEKRFEGMPLPKVDLREIQVKSILGAIDQLSNALDSAGMKEHCDPLLAMLIRIVTLDPEDCNREGREFLASFANLSNRQKVNVYKSVSKAMDVEGSE